MPGCMVAAGRQGPGVQIATGPALHCTLCRPAWTPRRPHGPGLRRGGTGHPPVRALLPWHRDPGGVRGPGPALNTTGGCSYLRCSRMGGPGDVALSLGTFRVRLGRGVQRIQVGSMGFDFGNAFEPGQWSEPLARELSRTFHSSPFSPSRTSSGLSAATGRDGGRPAFCFDVGLAFWGFCFWPHPVMIGKYYSWRCSGDPLGCQGSNPGHLCAGQMPCPLYCCFALAPALPWMLSHTIGLV